MWFIGLVSTSPIVFSTSSVRRVLVSDSEDLGVDQLAPMMKGVGGGFNFRLCLFFSRVLKKTFKKNIGSKLSSPALVCATQKDFYLQSYSDLVASYCAPRCYSASILFFYQLK